MGRSGSRSRDEAKEETRIRLLQAGRQAFAEEGLDLPSLDGICARAGYTRGAFYVHFKTREEFLVAVMEDAVQEFINTVLGAGEEDGGLEDTVDRFVAALLQNGVPMLREGALHFHQLLTAASRSPQLRERFVSLVGQAMGRMARATRRAQQRGEARKGVAAEQVATLLIAAALGLVCMVESGIPFNPEALRRTVRQLLGPVG